MLDQVKKSSPNDDRCGDQSASEIPIDGARIANSLCLRSKRESIRRQGFGSDQDRGGFVPIPEWVRLDYSGRLRDTAVMTHNQSRTGGCDGTGMEASTWQNEEPTSLNGGIV